MLVAFPRANPRPDRWSLPQHALLRSLLPLLLLSGCLRGSAYPDRALFFADTGSEPVESTVPDDTPTLPCNRDDEGTTAQLTVTNANPELYQLGQMDAYCQEQFVAFINPNGAFQGSVGNHIFFTVREADGAFVRFFGIPPGANVQWVESVP